VDIGFAWEEGQFEQLVNVGRKTGVRTGKYNLITEDSPVWMSWRTMFCRKRSSIFPFTELTTCAMEIGGGTGESEGKSTSSIELGARVFALKRLNANQKSYAKIDTGG
jgi:hypothetical protein